MVEATAPLSRSARTLLAGFREHGRPDAEIARRSWREIHERIHHPEAQAREAWAASLPIVDEPYDDVDEPLSMPAPRNDFLYWTRAAATSVAIAAAVLLCVRVVATSATLLTQQARSEALEAPYQGGAELPRGQAVAGQPAVAGEGAKRRGAAGRSTTAVAPAAAPAELAVPTESALPQPELEPAAMQAAVAATHRKARSGKPKATELDDVAAELSLVRAATTAHNEGDRGRAQALLSEHARLFPGGVMADEREVLRAEVLCAQGKKTDAKALMQRFAAAHPTASLLGRMNKACVD